MSIKVNWSTVATGAVTAVVGAVLVYQLRRYTHGIADAPEEQNRNEETTTWWNPFD